MELKVKDIDKESGDSLYEPVDVPVQKKYVADKGSVSFIFDELQPPASGPSANGFCGMTATMATKLQNVLATIDKGSMVKVTLVDKMNNGANSYRNIVRLEPLDIGGEPVVTEQATQEVAKPVVNTKTMGRVPPAWEMGVDYNNKKDNKICLNVACNNAVAMFGHMSTLMNDDNSDWREDHAPKYQQTYDLAISLIEKLASLEIEEEEVVDEE